MSAEGSLRYKQNLRYREVDLDEAGDFRLALTVPPPKSLVSVLPVTARSSVGRDSKAFSILC